jgi:hypothetical protein
MIGILLLLLLLLGCTGVEERKRIRRLIRVLLLLQCGLQIR